MVRHYQPSLLATKYLSIYNQCSWERLPVREMLTRRSTINSTRKALSMPQSQLLVKMSAVVLIYTSWRSVIYCPLQASQPHHGIFGKMDIDLKIRKMRLWGAKGRRKTSESKFSYFKCPVSGMILSYLTWDPVILVMEFLVSKDDA